MKIGVIGAGSWGTALAGLIASKGFEVAIWAYEPEVAEGINSRHRNPLYLSDFSLPHTLKASNDIAKVTSGSKFIVFVVPSHVTRITAKMMAGHIDRDSIFISCTKGIETDTGKLISNVLAESLPALPKDKFFFLSGPSFAREVAQRLPTTVVIAGGDKDALKSAQEIFKTEYFMPFTSEDVIGVQVGGAVKNVIAIACGISDGLGFGNNTRAATITRGLYEMIKIGRALGANPLTFAGLAGIGDLILTCTSELSRNRQVGFDIGRGNLQKETGGETKQVAEGIATAKAVYQLTKRLNINAPICTEVYRMIHEGKSPMGAVKDLIKMEMNEELRGAL